MSESDYFKSESYLRGANNDGMDPHWKPSFEDTPSIGKKIDALISSANSIRESILGKFSKEDLKKDGAIQVSKTNQSWLEFIESVEALK